jgi:hypothetical protein
MGYPAHFAQSRVACLKIAINYFLFVYYMGHAVVQLVEALLYKPERRGLDS